MKRSYLGESVLLDWADGALHANGVVKYSRFAVRDGLQTPMLERFAKCGGENFENTPTRFKELLREAGSERKITALDGPIFKFGLLPSEVIKLIPLDETKFKLHLAPHDMKEFWEIFFSSEDGQRYKELHPHLRDATPESLRYRFLIRIHEDSAPYSKAHSADTISWSSSHGSGSELEVK